jgi:hypothetical protein
VYDLPSTRTAAEQQQVIDATNAIPRVTLTAAAAAAEVIKLHAEAARSEGAAAAVAAH